MPRYNCTFSLEKSNKLIKKFEVFETESNNKDYVIGLIAKKYPKHKIVIKKMTCSINGKANSL
jgi:hypothetical protein